MGWISRILGFEQQEPAETGRAPAPAAEPPLVEPGPGRTVYAIGDIHGRADLLSDLLRQIGAELEPDRDNVVVYLGDYIDRGEQSRDVIDLCRETPDRLGTPTVFLRGNHEQAMLDFLDDPAMGAAWLRFGGLATLMSYGVRDISEQMPPERLARAAEQLNQNLPDDHRRFLEATIIRHRIGNLCLCHAGVNPERSPENQTESTLLWGQDADAPPPEWPLTVVQGHVVVDRPTLSRRRINVDTGAYFSGRLTAARIRDGEIGFLQT